LRNFSGILVFLAFVLVCGGIFAQDSASRADDTFFDGDLDSLFGELSDAEDIFAGETEEFSDTEIPPSNNDTSAIDTSSILGSALRKVGFTLDAGFNAAAGYAPGWNTAPWYWNEAGEGFDNLLLAKMESSLALDIQLSDVLRVKQTFALTIPGLALTIPEFFFDYNLLDVVFFRAGKYVLNWGISPNFPYTNLPSRSPDSGDLYLARADIPVGIGGFQVAAMTRSVNALALDKISFGLKYNIAVPVVDIDTGFLYNTTLDSKAFISLKTTLFDQLELYSEALVSYNFNTFNNFATSGSIGFVQEFFNRQLMINAEFYYNGETNASYVQSESFLVDAGSSAFIYGFNTALNIRYKPSWLRNTELFLNYLHGFNENTVQLVPGFRITPFSNFSLNMAIPMALGSKNGYYYTNNVDEHDRPFAIILMLTFSGSYRYSNM
jgi:hypothetical protein